MATDFLAGCVGGGAGVIVGHPLDTVKVRLQTQSGDNVRYKGTLHALVTITKQESFAGLYRGISSPLYGVSLVNALVFGVYGCLQPFVLAEPGNNAVWAHVLAGSLAGASQSVVCSPMELVKIRMQLNESSYKQPSSFSVLKNIYQTNGLRTGVFKGWSLTVLREIPGFGAYFGSYEMFIQFLEKSGRLNNEDGQVGTVGMMMSGGSAGVVSWLACFPMDVIKTRFQSDTVGKYNGVWDCARKTFQSEGYRVFTRTLPSLLIRAFPMNAVTFPVVTWVIRFFEAREGKDFTARQEIDDLISRTRNLTTHDIYRKIYDVPSYHMLTPRTPTVMCTETQNLFSSVMSLDSHKKKATICPCCALAEVYEPTPLFYDQELEEKKHGVSNYEANDDGSILDRTVEENGQEKVQEREISFLGRILQSISSSFLPSTPDDKKESEESID